ncbi:MAG: DUF4123 domain-containing protein [bacterium]|nr:DUF4123 domain-containing protein [bacterium]
MKDIFQSVSSRLFAAPDAGVFAVLDGASVPGLPQSLYRHEPDHECLYRGQLEPDMAEVAPYLVQLEQETEFTRWVIEQGWGNHWGIFALSSASLRDLRQHFRRHVIAYDAEGQPAYFRYYDPRVLRAYLPTCDANELAALFGPVTSFLLEDEDPETMLIFRMSAGSLKVERESLAT